jgi:multidrug transporter EmrE-like cation transporter
MSFLFQAQVIMQKHIETSTTGQHRTVQSSSSAVSTPSAMEAARSDRLRIVLALLALYLIWGSTYFAISIAIQSIPPLLMVGARFVLATSYAYVNPLVAVCLGVALAGDRVTPLGIVGMVVILVGVVLVSLARGRAASAEPAHSVTSAAPGDSSPSASQAESGQ